MSALVIERLVESHETGRERVVLRGDAPLMSVADAVALAAAEPRSISRATYARLDDADSNAPGVLDKPHVAATTAIDGRGRRDVGHR